VTGWTQLGVLVWIVITTAALTSAGMIVLAVAAIRHLVRWCFDEHAEVRDQRRTTPTERCWVSPDEELQFEEITGPLGVELEARRQARYGDDGPRLTLGGGPC
jgi:hypothetical protein